MDEKSRAEELAWLWVNDMDQKVASKGIQEYGDARAAEARKKAEDELEMANGCLNMVAEILQEIGCKCGSDVHKSTPPMMYPEWIACTVKSKTFEARKRTLEEAESICKAWGQSELGAEISYLADSPAKEDE